VNNTIRIEGKEKKKNYYKISEVAFSDNGCGMDASVLTNCLAMGYSSRYGDRGGIGRFGVGMTLASINQCKKVEIYSKAHGGAWLYTYIDLDEITDGTMDEIPEAREATPPAKYSDMISNERGTLVIWKKYDKQPESADKIEQELHIWMGRTYRYFIWDDITLTINNKHVYAIDPLYVNANKTQNPDIPVAKEYDPIVFNYATMKELDDPEDLPLDAPIKIRLSILPEEFRQKQGAGGSEEAIKYYINRNNGLSIVRNRREVFYGEIPYFKPAFEEIDRWWGCEISFNAVLDKAFTVKNIKRGAIPVADLRERIQDEINPTRKTVKTMVQKFWREQEAKAATPPEEDNGHGEAEDVAGNTQMPKSQIDKNKNTEDEIDRAVDLYSGDDQAQKDALRGKLSKKILAIEEREWLGSDFFNTEYLGGKSLLVYNTRHQFFKELDKIMQAILVVYTVSRLHQALRTLIDLLLVSFSKAEALFDPGQSMKVETFMEDIKADWGKFLKQYLETWQAHKEEDDL
jgi:hypothetical protein